MKGFLKCIVFCVALSGACLAANSKFLSDNIPNLIAHRLPHAVIGVAVADANDGHYIYDYHGDQAFLPASNMKLLTAIAGLFYLKSNYSYHTTINSLAAVHNGTLPGDLYFNFVGDPSFTIEDLKGMLLSLKKQGIKHIAGNVVLDTSQFSTPNYATGWKQSDINWYYSAPVTAVTLNENFVRFSLSPNFKVGTRTGYTRGPNTQFFKVTDKVIAASQQEANGHCHFDLRMNENNDLYFGGCWPARRDPSVLQIAVKNPTLFAENIIGDDLKEDGITVSGKIIVGMLPGKTRVLVQHDSASFLSLVTTMLKRSDNFYAECFLKTMGYLYYHKGTFQDGVLAVKAILAKHTSVDFKQAPLYDGSGQSYDDKVTPRQFVTLLYDVRHSSIYNDLYSALPISGRDGTLAYRMGRKPLLGRVHAKTGTLRGGVSTLSGYVYDASGRQLVFSILVNHVPGQLRTARAFQDAVVALLYRL